MFRLKSVWLVFLMLVPVGACRQHEKAPQPAVSEPGIREAYSVYLDITPIPDPKGATVFLATYNSQGKTAKFQIELDPSGQPDSKSAPGFNFRFGKGRINAEPGSDASVLLGDLKKALEANALPAHVQRVKSLPITYAILGENESMVSGGGFNDKPPGNWTAMKIFIPTATKTPRYFSISISLRRGLNSLRKTRITGMT